MTKRFSFLRVLFMVLVTVTNASAQWATSGTNINNTNTGNVGIGTTTPSEKLSVAGNINLPLTKSIGIAPTTDFFSYDSKNVGRYSLGWAADSWFSTGSTAFLSGYGGVKLFTNNTPRLVISNTGNVGIGVINPIAMLHVGSGSIVWGNNSEMSSDQGGAIALKGSTATSKPYIDFMNSTVPAALFDMRLQLVDDDKMNISGGTVGINTSNPDYDLTVNGKIKCEEVRVVVDVPADYVFELEYNLMPLSEVGKYVKENKHLPNVPSAEELKQNGWNVGEMNNKLLEKIEELTLYLVQLKDQNEELKARVEALESQKR